ncbi:ATP-dependent DNA helicase II subunit 1 [Saitozyma podzolica]|uniref:ATP-dependent DNA helicase II subunit 1 n=1 Tax=Saitozyma podzolica TaxID=1890683 RepID=A0A427YLB5_9TREE|nr:ATP-dependent DNA helicase II subunit 1 [Saitozyma podzolica]
MSSYYGDRSHNVPSWESFEAGDDDDIVDTSEYQYASRDHILFCIDASLSMHTPLPDRTNPEGLVRGKSALHQVLEFVADFEKGKVITGPADSVGVVLYNVDTEQLGKKHDKSAGSSISGPGTLVYQSLRMINAEEIKRIIKLVEAVQAEYDAQDGDEDVKTVEPDTLKQEFPARKKAQELNTTEVLRTCNTVFRDAGTKLVGNQRVFLVTDNDEPAGSHTSLNQAQTTYNDLAQLGVAVNTFFIDRPDHRFDPTIFWNTVLGRGEAEDAPKDSAPDQDGLGQLKDIMNDLVVRNAPKRTQFSIPLKFGGKDGDIEIGISGYATVSTQGKGQPKYVRMRGQTVEEVVTKTEYTSAETGAVLPDDEIGQAYQFGNEATVRNVLEPNWWESDEHAAEAQMVADEALRLDMERRRKEEEGEEEDMDKEVRGVMKQVKALEGEEKPKIVARTRLQFTPDEVQQFKSMGLPPQIKILGFQSPRNLKIDENIKHSYFIYPDETAYTGSTRSFAALLKSCLKLDRHALALCRLRTNTQPEFAVLIPQAETFTKDRGQDDPPGFHVIPLPFRDDIRQPPKNMTDNLVATERQAKLMSNVVKRLRFAAGKYRSEAYPNPSLAYHYAQLQSLAFEEDFDPENVQDKTIPKHGGMHKAAGEFMREWNQAIDEDDRCAETMAKGAKRAAVQVDEEDLADVQGSWEKGKLDKLKVQELRDYAKYKKISLEGKSKKADIIDVISEYLEKEGGDKKVKHK